MTLKANVSSSLTTDLQINAINKTAILKAGTTTQIDADLWQSWYASYINYEPVVDGDIRLLSYQDVSDNPMVNNPVDISNLTNKNFIYNYIPNNYKNLRLALSNAKIGITTCFGMFLGDSTTQGSSGSIAAMKPNSYVTRLKDLLNGVGILANSENWMGSAGADQQGTTLPVIDPRVALGAGWGIFIQGGIGGSLYRNNSNVNAITFTPTVPTDTCDVYYLDGAPAVTYDAISIKTGVDGTVAAASGGTVVATATYQVRKATAVAPSLISNVWTVQKNNANGNTLAIVGMSAYNNTAKSVNLLNCGVGGRKLDYFLDRANNWNANVTLEQATVKPNFVIINLGINDWLQGSSVVAFQANLNALVLQLLTQGTDVILVTPVPTANSLIPTAVQNQYIQCYYNTSLQFGVALVDVWQKWQSPDPLGIAWYGDTTIHPKPVGYQDVAKTIFNLFSII
jgi:lysophospholipase L1-like esterase